MFIIYADIQGIIYVFIDIYIDIRRYIMPGIPAYTIHPLFLTNTCIYKNNTSVVKAITACIVS